MRIFPFPLFTSPSKPSAISTPFDKLRVTISNKDVMVSLPVPFGYRTTMKEWFRVFRLNVQMEQFYQFYG